MLKSKYFCADMHVHTYFSPDSRQNPQDAIDSARAKGINTVAFTDHIDFCFEPMLINFNEYFKTFENLQKTNPDIKILIGIEAGWSLQGEKQTAKIINSYPFEYVINSIHYINGSNPYLPHLHYNRSKTEVYNEYLDAIIASLNAPYRFDALGHLGYIERNAPYENRAMAYDEFKPKLDKIIDLLLENDIALEINTSGLDKNLNCLFQPRADFISAYIQAGGNKIVFGSDAHSSGSIAKNFDIAANILKPLNLL